MSDYLIYRTLPQCRMIQVVEDFKFWVKAQRYTIPAGFVFDGFSNPRLLWRVLPSSYGPRVLDEGCKHDYFYRTHELKKDDADRFLEAGCIKNGIGRKSSRCIYWGVKFGGHHAYKAGPKKPLIGLWGKAAEVSECTLQN